MSQDGIDGAVGFGDRIVSELVFGFDRPGGKALEHDAGGLQSGLDALREYRRRKNCHEDLLGLIV